MYQVVRVCIQEVFLASGDGTDYQQSISDRYSSRLVLLKVI